MSEKDFQKVTYTTKAWYVLKWEKYGFWEVYTRIFSAKIETNEKQKKLSNSETITSQYMPSYKFTVRHWIWTNWSKNEDFWDTFKSKKEAIEFAKKCLN